MRLSKQKTKHNSLGECSVGTHSGFFLDVTIIFLFSRLFICRFDFVHRRLNSFIALQTLGSLVQAWSIKDKVSYLHRTITGIGFRAFGPFLIPLLWGETCKPNKILKTRKNTKSKQWHSAQIIILTPILLKTLHHITTLYLLIFPTVKFKMTEKWTGYLAFWDSHELHGAPIRETWGTKLGQNGLRRPNPKINASS